jgi:glycosyltransferase involved in cell wall biosynthesis
VAYVIPSLEIGGTETQLVRLINSLDRQRFLPTLICPFGAGPLRSRLDGGVEVTSPSLPRLSRLSRREAATTAFRAVAAIRGHLVRHRPDIVHGYLMTSYALGAMAARTVGTRVVIGSRRGLDTARRRPSRGLRLIARSANHMIDYHLCNSEAVRQLAIADEGIPISKSGVIYNGIDAPDAANRPELPKEWGLSESDGRAAMVANFHSYKRHADVLEAVTSIVRQRPRFKLVLFGDGAERASIERLIAESNIQNNVVLAGARLDAADLLSGFDLSVLASSRESFPNALMESMARGVPVVATKVGGVPELVRDGVDGTLVEPEHPEQLAAAMVAMLDAPDLRRRMGEAGRERIRQEFSVEAMTTQTEDLYVKLLKPKTARFPAATVLHG